MGADLIVIGGGAAGLGAARAARRRGAQVTLVSEGPLGGDCTFVGCVPSKSLLVGAREGLSFSHAMERTRLIVAEIAATENEEALRREGVDVRVGRATFDASGAVFVDGVALPARRVVVATGARAVVPPIPGLTSATVLTNDNVFALNERPARLAILGGGPIGVEMAEAFARLGSVVTIIEAAPRLLPREEPEASAVIEEYLTSLDVRVHTSTTCREVLSSPSTRLICDGGVEIDCDAVLVAVGRRAQSGGFGLDECGVRVDDRGFIVVDEHLRTSVRHIFAAGDVAQTLQFTHVADETGRIAAANALARVAWRRFHPEWIPSVTYTGLEVARVGVTEADAGRGARVAYLPMSEFDRALMAGEARGFVKVIVEPRRVSRNVVGGSFVGATVVGPRAGEVVHEIVLAMRAGLSPARLATTTHAYPSWSTSVQMTCAQFFGEFGGRRARPASPRGNEVE